MPLSLGDYAFIEVFRRASSRDKLILVGGSLLAVVVVPPLVMQMPNEYTGRVALKEMCWEPEVGLNVAEIADRLGSRSFGDRGCAEDAECFTETVDGVAYRYSCYDDGCVTFWTADDWTCRLVLTPKSKRIMNPGELQTDPGGPWKSAS